MTDALSDVRLTPLEKLTGEHKEALRQTRNEPAIRNNMYTNHVISSAEHAAWLERASTDDTLIVHGVFAGDALIGAANFTNVDHAHKRSDWAFYLGEAARGKGAGSRVEFLMLERFFVEMTYQKLNCEVLETNTPVLSLHEKFGFQREGLRRHHILRDGAPIGAHMLGITRDEWMAKREEMHARLRTQKEPVNA